MPTYILKPSPNSDYYIEWSTVVDNVMDVYNSKDEALQAGIGPSRLERADATGSSSLKGHYGYDDPTIAVSNMGQSGLLKLERTKLLEFAQAILSGDKKQALNLLERYE